MIRLLCSGGQDSATCLAWALVRYQHVETVGFAYEQRHAVELDCRTPIRAAIAAKWPGRPGPDHTIDLTATLGGLSFNRRIFRTRKSCMKSIIPVTVLAVTLVAPTAQAQHQHPGALWREPELFQTNTHRVF